MPFSGKHPIILIVIFSLAPSAFAQKDEFHWCQDVAHTSNDVLMKSQVLPHPDGYEKKSHTETDGSWDFPLPVSAVWDQYTQTPMSEAWTSYYIINQFTLEPGSTERIDVAGESNASAEAHWPGLNQGTRIFLNIKSGLIANKVIKNKKILNFLGDTCQMAIGFEVTEVKKYESIKLEYLDFSPPYGEQTMTFKETQDESGNPKTTVTQVSTYLGKNKIIDKMYPYFHKEEIPKLHEQMQKLAAQKRK